MTGPSKRGCWRRASEGAKARGLPSAVLTAGSPQAWRTGVRDKDTGTAASSADRTGAMDENIGDPPKWLCSWVSLAARSPMFNPQPPSFGPHPHSLPLFSCSAGRAAQFRPPPQWHPPALVFTVLLGGLESQELCQAQDAEGPWQPRGCATRVALTLPTVGVGGGFACQTLATVVSPGWASAGVASPSPAPETPARPLLYSPTPVSARPVTPKAQLWPPVRDGAETSTPSRMLACTRSARL